MQPGRFFFMSCTIVGGALFSSCDTGGSKGSPDKPHKSQTTDKKDNVEGDSTSSTSLSKNCVENNRKLDSPPKLTVTGWNFTKPCQSYSSKNFVDVISDAGSIEILDQVSGFFVTLSWHQNTGIKDTQLIDKKIFSQTSYTLGEREERQVQSSSGASINMLVLDVNIYRDASPNNKNQRVKYVDGRTKLSGTSDRPQLQTSGDSSVAGFTNGWMIIRKFTPNGKAIDSYYAASATADIEFEVDAIDYPSNQRHTIKGQILGAVMLQR